MHHMTECHSGKDEGGVRRRFIEALSRSDGHVNRRGARAPQVASSRKTKGGEQANMSGGGDPGDWRTRPTKRRSRVVSRAGEEIALKHVEQGSIGTSRWQGRSRHIAQGEVAVNDISRVIMMRKAQMDSPSTFVGVYVTKDQKRMDKVREIPAAQLTRLLDVNNTSKLGFMEFDGTVHREFPTRKQVSTFIPLMDSWEIMAPSSSLSTFRRLAAWVNSSAPSFPLGVQILFIHPSLNSLLLFSLILRPSCHSRPQKPQQTRPEPPLSDPWILCSLFSISSLACHL
jgi:hypothetical protein